MHARNARAPRVRRGVGCHARAHPREIKRCAFRVLQLCPGVCVFGGGCLCAGVCACVRVCVCACVCARVCARLLRVCACAHAGCSVRVGVQPQPACKRPRAESRPRPGDSPDVVCLDSASSPGGDGDVSGSHGGEGTRPGALRAAPALCTCSAGECPVPARSPFAIDSLQLSAPCAVVLRGRRCPPARDFCSPGVHCERRLSRAGIFLVSVLHPAAAMRACAAVMRACVAAAG